MRTVQSKKIPTLRFPEFSGEWEERKLGDLGSVKMCKRIFAQQTKEVGEVPFYKIGTLGGVADAFINMNLFEDYKSKYNFPRKGQTLITCSGTIGKCVQFDGRDSYYQDSNIVWIDNDNEVVDDDFLFLLLTNCRWDKLNSTTITRIYTNDLRSLKFQFPKSEEQQKITSFLTSIDDWIENLKKQKEAQEKYKKGMMQKIFPSAGSGQVPEIRFKPAQRSLGEVGDENGEDYPEWEEKRLGEIAEISKGSGISKSDISEEGEYQCIRYGELYTKYSEVITQIFSKTNLRNKSSVVSGENDLLIPSSGETALDIARISHVMPKGVLLGGDITVLSLEIMDSGVFFAYYLSHEKKHDIAKLAQGNSVVHIYGSHLKSLEINRPCTEEQNKIADFLSSIDDLINLTNQRITHAEKWKKGVMQGVFV